jgi:probable HAF family extracellular repeat protein
MIRRLTVLLTAVVAGIVLVSGMALSQTASVNLTYSIKELGTLGGNVSENGSAAWGINDSGEVVGYTTTSSGGTHAFLYSGGRMQDLGTLPGGGFSFARDVNDSGQVVGYSTITSTGETHAFLYSDGKMHDLNDLIPADFGLELIDAYAINNSGQIVGSGFTSNGEGRAFLYSDGQIQDLSMLIGDAGASDINDSGQIVGAAETPTGELQAFVYSEGEMQPLGTLLGGGDSQAMSISDSGRHIAGFAFDRDQSPHAFLYSGEQMQDLGTLPGIYQSFAEDVNDSGQVVGYASNCCTMAAFVYSDGEMQDLNDFIPVDSGLELNQASGINNSGQIVGFGMLNGEARAFLATPATSTIDTKPPKVISTSPKADATEVAPTANVKAAFSEDMDSKTINGTTFQLFEKGTTTQISATVSYNADAETAKLDPNNNLRRGVAYKAVVTTWAKDVAENRLDQDGSTSGFQQMRWFFRVDD